MSPWSIYMLRCTDGTLYTGITKDVQTRIEKHNDGTGAKYTRARRPVALVWSARASTESAARKREAKIKGWTRAQKERLLKKRRSRPA
ncbi:MAG TPA: GIY-YIG nuclease family protein [Candidatus Methylomirabilis sp.]|nr:GIY-YIG nuclease family protein [Candidatus Methylomirabilis sp.]